MENQPTEPVSPSGSEDFENQNLDDLLSMRGKPFTNWKEERLYLRDKWGMQGRKVEPGELQPSEQDKEDS
jgi:hypothetical protein